MKAFITGITGQDGSYLAELLLEKGYEVHGLVRRVALESPSTRLSRIEHILKHIHLHPGTIESYSRLLDIFDSVRPDECYHLAAQSFVHESFDDDFSTMNTNINGTHHVLSALHKRNPECRFYFAGSSEMFGRVHEVPQSETTRFHPRSPYGISKVTGYELTRNYREFYNMFACSGILFNHESPRRGYEFITRKVSSSVARIKAGKENVLVVGNIDAKRDWGFAGDYVRAMWQMLQSDTPDDYVVATGVMHSVRQLLHKCFEVAELKYDIIDLHELSVEEADRKLETLREKAGKTLVVQHPRFYRPAEVDELIGNASKARNVLGWEPRVSFDDLVTCMVEHDIENVKQISDDSPGQKNKLGGGLMKILLLDDTPAYFCHGGKQVLAAKIHESLRAIGIDVEYARWWDPDQKCDLLHLFAYSPSVIRMARQAGVKVILTHIMDGMTNRSRSARTYHRFRNRAIRRFLPGSVLRLFSWHILPTLDAFVYLHEYDAETAVSIYDIPRDKTHIIPHGCDTYEMDRLGAGPVNERSCLVSVGSIIPRKNCVLLAKAARRARVPVVFLGKPFNEKDSYFQEFESLVDGKSVIYSGYVSEDEKIRLLTRASGFVLPSTGESGCVAVYEAAVAGLPMLLSNLPWAHSYGKHLGIQYVDLSDEKSLADHLESFFAASKRQDSPTFPVMTWEEIARKYVDVYKSVLGVRGSEEACASRFAA